MSGLEKLTVLLVEDSPQVRSLFVSVLNQLGIGQIIRAPEGAEAIRLIRQTQHDPASAGASAIDMIISDWVMDPIDGATLLRWVRRHKDSPDRFLPFVMVSAYSEWHRVQSARELGVNEFLAKPFSVASVLKHIIAVIQDRRRYVRTNSFFGPDRRRTSNPIGVDLRTIHTSNEDAIDKGIRFYSPPRFLRAKTGGDISFDASQIANIQNELDSWNDDFVNWTLDYIENLKRLVAATRRKEPSQRRGDFDKVNQIAHELRGQGGIFGYPLVSLVAKSLFELTKDTLDRSDECLHLIQNHIETLQIVLRDEVRGDGGNLGFEIVKAMRLANAKFLKERQDKSLVGRDFLQSNR
jgi:CheY-like chemotaxis protein